MISLIIIQAIYISGKLNTVKSEIYKFPIAEEFKVSIKSLEGWKTTIYPDNYYKFSVSQVSINFKSYHLSISGYFQSWTFKSTPSGMEDSLSQIPSYVSRVFVAFASPVLTYTKGLNSFAGRGVYFSSSFEVVKEAIALAHQQNEDKKFLLSVGGATYPWKNQNYQTMVDLMMDLGLDGIDIDFENQPSCKGVDTANLSYNTDNSLIEIINHLRNLLPQYKLLTAAVFFVGAYGTPKFLQSKFGSITDFCSNVGQSSHTKRR